jgi:hypothetical protein
MMGDDGIAKDVPGAYLFFSSMLKCGRNLMLVSL